MRPGIELKAATRRRRWLNVFGLVVVLAIFGHVAMRVVLSTSFLQERFSRALSEASGGLYRIQLGSTEFDLVRNRMHATDVALFPDSAALADSARTGTPEGLYSISAPVVTVEGTSLFALMNGRIKASSLRLVRPHLHLALDSRRSRPRDTSMYATEEASALSDARAAESFHVRLARQLPRMTIKRLRIDSAAFSWERVVDRKVMRDSVGNISVELRGINTDSISAVDTTRVLFSNDVRFSVPSYARMSEDGVYVMSVDSLHGSTGEGTLALRALQFVPILSDSQLKRKLTRVTTRYQATAADIRMSGINFRGIFDNSSIAIGLVDVRQPELDIYLDRTLPPRSRVAATLPHQALQSISWDMRLDTLRIQRGRILYSERAANGARPGVMRFEEFAGELRNVSNNAAPYTQRTTMDIRTRLNGAGELTATVEYDMVRRGLNMSYRGSITAMDAAAFNEVLVDIEGIKVETGMLDTAWFDIEVVRDRASGQVQMKYHDLKVAFQNKNTGGRGILNRIKSFVANAIKLKGANPPSPDKPATIADVDLRRSPELPLFGFMWHTIRSGLMTTLGM